MSLTYGYGRVKGALHEERGMACEDAVGMWCDARRGLYVGVVADGHGDSTCVRSAVGAQLAVDVAIERLKGHAGGIDARELADVAKDMVREWKRRVLADLSERPIGQDEIGNVDLAVIEQWRMKHPAHLYGATLVAMLLTREYCAFIQQGDGCCALMQADGALVYPVPEDEMCVGNLTTSLSDDDAEERIRYCGISLSENRILGCFVASDGVEKSYVSREHLDAFFRDAVIEAQQKRTEELCTVLTKNLAEVSKHGSRDDSSLACVVECKLASASVDYLRRMNDRLRMRYELTETRDKLVSMSRKHDMLEEQWRRGDGDVAQEYTAYHAAWQDLVQRERTLVEQISAIDEASDDVRIGELESTESDAHGLVDEDESTEILPEQQPPSEEPPRRAASTEPSSDEAAEPSNVPSAPCRAGAGTRIVWLLVGLIVVLVSACGVWILLSLLPAPS